MEVRVELDRIQESQTRSSLLTITWEINWEVIIKVPSKTSKEQLLENIKLESYKARDQSHIRKTIQT